MPAPAIKPMILDGETIERILHLLHKDLRNGDPSALRRISEIIPNMRLREFEAVIRGQAHLVGDSEVGIVVISGPRE